jgi:hypothetical protein
MSRTKSKGETKMFGIEIAFYALGFLTCLALIAIITEVNDREKSNKKELRKTYRNALAEQKVEDNREEINIDVKVW